MSRWYLDTSAALKLLVEEAESAALAAAIDEAEPDLVGCYLLETELRRAATRIDELTQQAVTLLLEGVALYDVPPALFREAGLLPGASLRSLDAIHLAAAVRLGAAELVTYDQRMRQSATELGIPVLVPGSENPASAD